MSFLGKDVTAILIKIQNGDERSKNLLFEKTYNHLKIVAYRYVRNKNDVEDVLIEAYLRIFQYIKSFQKNKDGYNWICKIVQNTAFDWNKKHIEESLFDELENRDTGLDIDEKILIKDEVARLLQGYSERDRKIIYMRFFEDRTLEDIASALHMKKSNVHKRISKILKELLQKEKNRVEK